jgi:hypothetical protein
MFYPRGETISFPRKKPLHSVQSWMMFCPRPASDVSYSNHSPNPLTEFLSKTTLKPENCEGCSPSLQRERQSRSALIAGVAR